MSRVLLIDPPLYKHSLWDPIRTSQPLGIWSIGSFLKRQGHDVRLVCAPLQGIEQVTSVNDGNQLTLDHLLDQRLRILETTSTDELADKSLQEAELLRVGLSDEQILEQINQFDPDIVGIAALATCMHESFVALARVIYAHHPSLPIVAGGQHATAMTEELLRDAQGAISLVVVGEGEFVMADIVQRLPDLESARNLPGVAYLDDDGQLVKNKRPAWTNLTDLALLDPALMQHVPLRPLPVHTYGDKPKRYTDLMFSVGCHRGCPYCYSPIMRGKLRQLPMGGIIEQLRRIRAAGYDEIVLQDDDLLKNKDFFIGLLSAITKAGLSWQDNGGMELELLDDELVSVIIASGCTSIYIPVNPRQLADRLPTEGAVANIQYLKRLKDAGIYTFTSGIYGVPDLSNPNHTYDDVKSLRDFHLRLLIENYVDASLVFPLSALPGTVWFKKLQKSTEFSFDRHNWISYSIFVPQVYPARIGIHRLWREIIDTHRALNEMQDSLPWFSPFPNRLAPRGKSLEYFPQSAKEPQSSPQIRLLEVS